MNNFDIQGVGKIIFKMDRDLGKYTKITEDFLENLIKGTAKRSAEYYKNTEGRDHLFAYREKQLNTAVCPVIAEICSPCIFKMELPIKREGKARRGNLDYWIVMNDVVFALELKLAHVSYSDDYYKEKKSVYEKYNEALEQLKNIEKDDVPYALKNSDKMIKIVLEALVFQKKSKDTIKLTDYELKEIQQDIEKKINDLIITGKFNDNDRINFKAVWFLEKSLVSLEDVIYEKHRIIPVLGFIGHISDLKTRS